LWDQNGTTVAGQARGTSGSSLSQLNSPFGLSITKNDVLYVSDTDNNRIVVVQLGSNTSTFTIGSGPGAGSNEFHQPYDLFVTNTSLYVIDYVNQRMQKMSSNGSNPTTVLGFNGSYWPYYLYVNSNDSIYLSDTANHRVLFFLPNSTNRTIVAGTGVMGVSNDQLDLPYGIFVNHNGTMYIADHWNHRIMKWLSGALSGIVVAGNGTSGFNSTQLSYPTQVIVDTNEYMYISEGGNSRITRWASNSTFGVCIAACTRAAGTASNQLNVPHSLAFDSNGSLYVSDWVNNRVQKFQILQYNSEYIIS
jgi:sugar lactone lactonase YvrE